LDIEPDNPAEPTVTMPNSLAFRLLAITTVWTVTALLVTGLLLSTLFRKNAETNFEELLLAHTYNLMGAVEIGENAAFSGTPNLGDPRFLVPGSGWYWVVAEAARPHKPLLHSRSITGDDLEVASVDDIPFGTLFRRTYMHKEGEVTVQRLEAKLSFDESETPYVVMVGGRRDDLEWAVYDFNRTLAIFFSLFGLGTLVATFFVIRFGLKPLDRATDALTEVREGRSDFLEGEFPKEIEPLVGEINALVGANRSVVERARTQVGNLAHALKTPLAVIINEARKPDKQSGSRIAGQAAQMQSQIQTYLDRARIAAQRGVVTHRTQISDVVERLTRVMGKLSPHLSFSTTYKCEREILFWGEAQDLEEVLGNLLENASRFAKSSVAITVFDEEGEKPMVSIEVADDGPGLTEAQRKQALKRGTRLDESRPGSGLGLSIVQDIVDEYDGRFVLGRSADGGLSATVFLPKVQTSKNASKPRVAHN